MATNVDKPASKLESEFINEAKQAIDELKTEINQRNTDVELLDSYIYGDALKASVDVPMGHDKTPVNFLRRAVEIHRDQFMGRGFNLVSTYDSQNIDAAENEQDAEKIQIENDRRKQRAEDRRRLTEAIIRDNGGMSMWKDLAENAGAVGFSVLKAFYDTDEEKYVLSPVEAVDHFYAVWSEDDFRDADLYAFVRQVTPTRARELYGIEGDLATGEMGKPENVLTVGSNTEPLSSQSMVTIMELTGKVPGWGSDKGKLKRVAHGKENNLNALIVGANHVIRVIDDEKKLPNYYILPNKRQRRRPWGVSDITDAAVALNQTYIETLSDWRTVANKVNFPKFKLYGFDETSELPTLKKRKVAGLPLSEGQDITRLDTGDANSVDFSAQLEEVKGEFVKETAISRVLLDDPSITLNSNQALMTSMKATTDIAEAKKQLWEPVITKIFRDALTIISQHQSAVKDLLDEDEDWHFKIQWPSVLAKEDPVFQQMLLNRFNAGTMSIQSYLEFQGETKEEIDRLRDEMQDPVTAAILSRQLPLLAQGLLAPPGQPEPKVSVNLRGDLTPYQEANLATQQGFNEGPFPPTAGPQGGQGMIAQENADNRDFLTGNPFTGEGEPIQRGPDGQPVNSPAQVATPAQNQEGQQPVSQPGSGAPAVSAKGAVNQANQNSGA